MKWREFIALIGEATAGPPVVELPQHAGGFRSNAPLAPRPTVNSFRNKASDGRSLRQWIRQISLCRLDWVRNESFCMQPLHRGPIEGFPGAHPVVTPEK